MLWKTRREDTVRLEMLSVPLELSRIPIVTRVVCLASLFMSLGFWLIKYPAIIFGSIPHDEISKLPAVYVLTLVPRTSYYLIWTFITASFVNSNIFTLGISLSTLLLGGRYLERAWSSKELIKFYGAVILVPNVVIFTMLILMFVITRKEEWLFISIHGGIAIQSGILVAFKQLVPEHTVTLYKNLIKIRVKHFPALFLLFTIITAPLLSNYQSITSAILGFLASWVYLRFYKSSVPDLGSHTVTLKGDASETFALSQFFPEIMQGPIDAISNATFDLLVTAGICVPFGEDVLDQRNGLGHRVAGTGVGRAEAERRRTLALRALDQKLTKDTVESTQPGSTNLPPQVDH